MMATMDVHHIGCLSEEDSWFLFRQRAFTTGVEEESHIAIGKTIVKKCGGVPLAIKALGSLMRFKSHESEWRNNSYSYGWQMDLFPLKTKMIFKELVWRSFLQDVEINSKGDVTCKMHDLMHDLAVSIMKHETCIPEYGKVMEIPKTLRHLSFDIPSIWANLDNKRKLKFPGDGSLRSLICHKDKLTSYEVDVSSSLLKQRNLRALHDQS
ncbi:UNVERIFIED_CONTAM: putative disease resistance protein RGA1 [Sesamum angustifolium]|uniref:Disease resistance protein RGA1 n=1 Tax=Sesamum angustifolium TaxID=2727405 RepID=A0AAW2JBZ1_9LAMI